MFKRLQPGASYSSDDEGSSSDESTLPKPNYESQEEDLSSDSDNESTFNADSYAFQGNSDDEIPNLDEMSENELLELLDKEGLLPELMAQYKEELEQSSEEEDSESTTEESFPKRCASCPGKIFFNAVQINQHLESKQHKKNYRKYVRENVSTSDLVKKLEKNERKRERRLSRRSSGEPLSKRSK
ncbi:hypothetical protein RCL1_000834 [Eukaryota sp. TZLM3-RCL]